MITTRRRLFQTAAVSLPAFNGLPLLRAQNSNEIWASRLSSALVNHAVLKSGDCLKRYRDKQLLPQHLHEAGAAQRLLVEHFDEIGLNVALTKFVRLHHNALSDTLPGPADVQRIQNMLSTGIEINSAQAWKLLANPDPRHRRRLIERTARHGVGGLLGAGAVSLERYALIGEANLRRRAEERGKVRLQLAQSIYDDPNYIYTPSNTLDPYNAPYPAGTAPFDPWYLPPGDDPAQAPAQDSSIIFNEETGLVILYGPQGYQTAQLDVASANMQRMINVMALLGVMWGAGAATGLCPVCIPAAIGFGGGAALLRVLTS
jgi:hypothetical protein